MIAIRRLSFVGSVLLAASISGVAVGQVIDLPRPVPSFNQAYNEGPGAWGNCALGTLGCPDEICITGCLVTAFSSVLAYYEIDVAVSARASCTGQSRAGMDPGIFNNWLQETGGYGHCAQDPVGNCCLIWDRLPAGIKTTTHVNRSEEGISPVSAVVIDHALRQGFPVIAGVHWGTSCNGGFGQREDCHWVVLTGKRGDSYSIVDPFNPDPSSPEGVRTTLNAGVHGRYIIDRFVVVEGPTPGPLRAEIRATPSQSSFVVGDRVRFNVATPGRSVALLVFARVTRPSGDVSYAVLMEPSSRTPRFVAERASLSTDPRVLPTAWTWYDRTFTEADLGRWSWEIWVERVDEPGIKIGRQTISYTVGPATATSSLGAAVIGIVLVVVLATVAFLSARGAASP